MKTMTEFSGFNLRDAHRRSKEIQTGLSTPPEAGTEARPAEELATAHREALAAYLTEKFKLEGERMDLFVQALELVSAKPKELENLKRVVIYTVSEGEKVPSQVRVSGAHGLAAEYLPPVRGSKPEDRRAAGSKHSKKGGPGGQKGRGRRKPDLKGKRPDGGPERRGGGRPKPNSPSAPTP
jgi:hypothetical protein